MLRLLKDRKEYVGTHTKNMIEYLKELSDRLLLWFLRVTSGFERELTTDGRKEQAMWREQRLQNLQGLANRSRERYAKRDESS